MKFVFCFLSLLLAINQLTAATVLIDFGTTATNAGKGPTTGQPQVWNNFTASTTASSLSLVDTLGASTGYTIASDGAFSLLNEAATPVSSPYPNTAAGDAFYTTDERIFTFSGLDPLLTYHITVYGYANRSDSRLTNVTINSVMQSYQPANTGSGNTSGGSVTFSGLSANAEGIIDLKFTTGTSTNYILSVIELTAVPEPSRCFLFALGIGLIFSSRRRLAL